MFTDLQRFPLVWLNLGVAVIAGFVEGFGIVLFLPLLQRLSGSEASGLDLRIQSALKFAGIPDHPAWLVSVMVLVMIFSFVLVYWREWLLISSKYKLVANLRTELLDAHLHADWRLLSTRASGSMVSALLNEALRAAGAQAFQVRCVASLAHVAVLSVLSAWLSWQMFLISAVVGTVLLLGLRPLIARSRHMGTLADRSSANFTRSVVDLLRGIRLIKVTGLEQRALIRLKPINMESCDVSWRGENLLNVANLFLQAGPVILVGGIILLSLSVIPLPASALLTFLLALSRLAPRLIQLQQQYQAFIGYSPSIHAVESAIQEGRAHAERGLVQGRPFTTLSRDIRFNDVSFRFPDAAIPTIKGVDFAIPCNSTVAMVGSSGAGKSTIIDLLVGLHRPDTGQILLDGTDLNEMNLASWRHHIGYVTQDTMVFDASLRENMTFFYPEANDESIKEALCLAQLDQLLEQSADFLDIRLGEGGLRLSGGQRQRLALARALLGKPNLLILDEATSALDVETEQQVQMAIDKLRHQMTIVIVTHRLNTVRQADMIIVLEEGRIVESGSYAALCRGNTRFADLLRLSSNE